MSRLDVGTERSLRQVLRRMIVPAAFVGALFVVLLWRAPERASAPAETLLAGPTMGTRYTVKVVTPEPMSAEARAALEAGVAEALELVDASMSTWRKDSELERFNRAGTEPFAASPPFLEVVEKALAVSVASGGAFDVTIGPLVDAWGFGPEATTSMPSDDEIEQLLAASGVEHLTVDRDIGTIAKDREDVRVDLSALAKGYAVDRVARAVEQAGFSDFMVEIGGEVVARGRNVDGDPWRIGIEVPDPARRALYTAVKLDGRALATSGDYRNFRVTEDGKTISHIIDPRTGRPVTHSLASVSVMAPDCLNADAWATALTVLGPDEGARVARELEIPALFIFRRQDGTVDETTSGNFAAWRVVREERTRPLGKKKRPEKKRDNRS